jgi:chorismate mutase/prephenate dehydratase
MAVHVAYPGPEGTHAAAAAERLFPGEVELVAVPTFSAVVEATSSGAVEFGVLPIESSLAGPVAETHDLLYGSALAIVDETVLPIHHLLLAVRMVPLEEITIVRSHPMALDQCRALLASMPWATAIATPTTSDAAAQVAERGDPSEAAIASERAAARYGLEVLRDEVGDHPEAYTRFVAVAPYVRLDRTDEAWRTAFAFVTDHRPGALHRALEPFARHSLDLVQLVSRPIPQSPWRYRFDAVLAGHPLDPIVRETLAEMTAITRQLVVFGSYPAHA